MDESRIQPSANAAAFDPVRDDVFTRIARRYDRMCDLFSLFIHRRWKSHMAAAVARHPGRVVLDVASGTGDIPLRVLRRLDRDGKGSADRVLWVTDLCPGMLAMAQRKLAGRAGVRIEQADAHRLAGFADASADVFTASFAMKICDRRQVLAEAFRVLKPGGTFYCLEAARIPFAPLHALYLAYMRWCMPIVGRIVTGGDASAYLYLLRGIHDFPPQRAFAAEIESHGFRAVGYRNLTLGIVALHWGTKPN
ncbi:MAG: ubiquinone/menaquinone biosynthesis methyltransferase [Rhodospirillaceae bacterium]|nr:ubiquinone/menaquinone biosynthesis methyltransferase [Rhodospirillaceae bacterium]